MRHIGLSLYQLAAYATSLGLALFQKMVSLLGIAHEDIHPCQCQAGFEPLPGVAGLFQPFIGYRVFLDGMGEVALYLMHLAIVEVALGLSLLRARELMTLHRFAEKVPCRVHFAKGLFDLSQVAIVNSDAFIMAQLFFQRQRLVQDTVGSVQVK